MGCLILAGCLGGRDDDARPNPRPPLPEESVELTRDPDHGLYPESQLFEAWLSSKRWTGEASRGLVPFYQELDHALIWTGFDGLRPHGVSLLESIERFDAHGLDPSRYPIDTLWRRVDRLYRSDDPPENGRFALETDLSRLAVSVARDLSRGRIDPREHGIPWHTGAKPLDALTVLQTVAQADPDGVYPALEAFQPSHEAYRRLVKALAEYRRLALDGPWKAVPGDAVVEPGDAAPRSRLEALADRLSREGFLDRTPRLRSSPDADSLAFYEGTLAHAIWTFQSKRGIVPDSILGPETLVELEVPPEKRVRTLELNLERRRWVPRDLGDRHVEVNIAAYTLDLVERGRTTLGMDVVVGRESWGTPVFSDEVTTVVFQPHWYVPASIVEEEILPQAREDSTALARFEVAPIGTGGDDSTWVAADSVPLARLNTDEFRFRHPAGPDNPLGRVKVLFQNEFNIYLHDTSAEYLFQKTDRNFSHGCIRVEKPTELAVWILERDPEWDRRRVETVMDQPEREVVALKHPVPVHVFYWTAFVDDEGYVQFHQDVYGIDAALETALAEARVVRAGGEGRSRDSATMER